MAQEKLTIYNAEFSQEFSEMMKELGEVSQIVKKDPHEKTDWDDFTQRILKYLERIKELAKKYNADKFHIEASLGWPPRLNVNLTFNLTE
jgi:hypothetical protein